ncbi:hypothetical protein AB0O07_07840 [Streptomyces sp. NPDC093085]|uniref:hypothetical protein n=1 Tax=Streptomyces sp. NPDC093085 TaxID=3155068 RepID=UPI00343F41CE
MTLAPATVIGVDAATPGLADADHLARVVAGALSLPDGASVGTHAVREGVPHLALSVTLPDGAAAEGAWRALTGQAAGPDGPDVPGADVPGAGAHALAADVLGAGPVGFAFGGLRAGPEALAAGAAHAAAERASGAGRAVLFPGADALTGTVEVAGVVAGSAVDEVVLLGGAGSPGPARRVMTRDHVRPEWRAGRLVLTVMEAVGGVLVPFEVPDPTPCCADH